MGSLVIESTSSGPEYLQLSRAPLFVWSTNSSREHLQLSEVPTVVESTSSCPIVGVYPEYLELSRGPPSVRSISVSQEHEQLSKVPPVVQSDFCQTGSVIHKYQRFSAALAIAVGSLVVRALD